ncbi:hypothetical protein CC1G_09798 [Coprinopsis cinerea okayama7|uniref:Uncharacterized protein n=1 Tax=Coprinopsis cinerea (strain Okayama-7 / 130 / ATCC MYA-4618 / FGSC 9003) TaxID=240176 RepID=A8NM96_COPC7|nr:hypothetical protein CC1G_09798 [Coprinopsis cinerea okayama7\|eukprot:XP_001834871.2 hypothetical protein CC1G_09798 [Coprinopsis cinerea okayama7\
MAHHKLCTKIPYKPVFLSLPALLQVPSGLEVATGHITIYRLLNLCNRMSDNTQSRVGKRIRIKEACTDLLGVPLPEGAEGKVVNIHQTNSNPSQPKYDLNITPTGAFAGGSFRAVPGKFIEFID